MAISKDEIRSAVVESLNAIGDNVNWPSVSGQTDPINDLGLESLDGLDLCLEIEARLPCKIDEKLNPLVDDSKQCARTIDQIVDWLQPLMEESEMEAAHE